MAITWMQFRTWRVFFITENNLYFSFYQFGKQTTGNTAGWIFYDQGIDFIKEDTFCIIILTNDQISHAQIKLAAFLDNNCPETHLLSQIRSRRLMLFVSCKPLASE